MRVPWVLAGLCLALSSGANAQPAPDFVSGEVVVRFREGVALAAETAALTRIGGMVVETEPVLRWKRVRLTPGTGVSDAVRSLRADPAVRWAQPNYIAEVSPCESCPQDPHLIDRTIFTPNQWGIFRTGTHSLWRGGRGASDSSIIIAIVDTGIDDFASPHPDLAANVLASGYDFVGDDTSPTDVTGTPADPRYGHGTHVAGIAAAVSNTQGMTGVAYCAKLMIVRVADCTDACRVHGTRGSSGIRWAADHGAKVINCSWGGRARDEAVKDAVAYAIRKGAIVIAAAGNDTANAPIYPAGYDPVISVGASIEGPPDGVTAFSNWWDGLDVVAPGENVWSTVPGNSFATKNGTSMAAPFVAGIAAIVKARHPGLTNPEFETFIRAHARPLPPDALGDRDGFGLVSFTILEDWSDAHRPYLPGSQDYPRVRHRNHLWEWLGHAVTAERGWNDPLDEDGRPNIGGPADLDGDDDAIMPHSALRLPWLPPHIAGADTPRVDVITSVCRHTGPRYGGTPQTALHLDAWFNWNADSAFDNTAAEHEIVDRVEHPGTWAGDELTLSPAIVPPDEHILGNPLVIRARLNYGAGTASAAADSIPWGEVEDTQLLNFVEEFDTPLHVTEPPVFMDLGPGWTVEDDPTPPCANHGTWKFATTRHPSQGTLCNGGIEATEILATPLFDLTEFTSARIRFWYCHQFAGCSTAPDQCRVRVVIGGDATDVAPIPVGSDTMSVDLSPFAGNFVRIEFVSETDWPGRLAIDDVAAWGFDGLAPSQAPAFTLTRHATINYLLRGTWGSPDDNGAGSPASSDHAASIFQVRYSREPITTEAEWTAATRLVPGDVAYGVPFPVPAMPGSVHEQYFVMPSGMTGYHFAVRAEDEVTNRALICTPLASTCAAGGDSTAGTVFFTLAAPAETTMMPADTVVVAFALSNTGTVRDGYVLEAGGTRPWPLELVEDFVTVDPGGSGLAAVRVAIPVDALAGEADTLTLAAQSLTDSLATASASTRIVLTARTDIAAGPGIAPPRTLEFSGVDPNPFTREAVFRFALPRDGIARIAIHDVLGRRIATLGGSPLAAGRHALRWDGLTDGARPAPSGIYFAMLEARGESRIRKVLLTR